MALAPTNRATKLAPASTDRVDRAAGEVATQFSMRSLAEPLAVSLATEGLSEAEAMQLTLQDEFAVDDDGDGGELLSLDDTPCQVAYQELLRKYPGETRATVVPPCTYDRSARVDGVYVCLAHRCAHVCHGMCAMSVLEEGTSTCMLTRETHLNPEEFHHGTVQSGTTTVPAAAASAGISSNHRARQRLADPVVLCHADRVAMGIVVSTIFAMCGVPLIPFQVLGLAASILVFWSKLEDVMEETTTIEQLAFATASLLVSSANSKGFSYCGRLIAASTAATTLAPCAWNNRGTATTIFIWVPPDQVGGPLLKVPLSVKTIKKYRGHPLCTWLIKAGDTAPCFEYCPDESAVAEQTPDVVQVALDVLLAHQPPQ